MVILVIFFHTFVLAFNTSEQTDTSADCMSRKRLKEYTINIKLLVPNKYNIKD
jgi:hypothetical protein